MPVAARPGTIVPCPVTSGARPASADRGASALTKRRSTMTHAHGKRLSRRRLLANAAGATSLAVVAPLLGRPAISLAQTPVGTPPATFEAVLQAGLAAGMPGVALRVERGTEVVFDGAAGFASREQQTPAGPTDRFGV